MITRPIMSPHQHKEGAEQGGVHQGARILSPLYMATTLGTMRPI